MKNILLPTNFSKYHENALLFAIDLVKKANGKLFLLHVYDLPIFAMTIIDPTYSGEETMVSNDKTIRQKAHEKLKKIIDYYELSHIKHRALLREGNVIDEILKAIDTNDIDLVVMGSKGPVESESPFFISTTKSIIDNTSCPVFSIPKTARFNKISKIIYLCNLNYDESKVLNYTIDLAKLYGVCITVIHINSTAENLPLINSEVKVIKEIANKLDCPTTDYELIISKNIMDGLTTYIKENETNVIAMTSYTTHLLEKLFHKSLTKQLLLHTQIPLLAFNGDKM